MVDALKCIRGNKNKTSSSPTIVAMLKMKTAIGSCECLTNPVFPQPALRAGMGRTVPSPVPVAKASVTHGPASAPAPPATRDLPVSKVTKQDQVTSHWVTHLKYPANKHSARHCSEPGPLLIRLQFGALSLCPSPLHHPA